VSNVIANPKEEVVAFLPRLLSTMPETVWLHGCVVLEKFPWEHRGPPKRAYCGGTA